MAELSPNPADRHGSDAPESHQQTSMDIDGMSWEETGPSSPFDFTKLALDDAAEAPLAPLEPLDLEGVDDILTSMEFGDIAEASLPPLTAEEVAKVDDALASMDLDEAAEAPLPPLTAADLETMMDSGAISPRQAASLFAEADMDLSEALDSFLQLDNLTVARSCEGVEDMSYVAGASSVDQHVDGNPYAASQDHMLLDLDAFIDISSLVDTTTTMNAAEPSLNFATTADSSEQGWLTPAPALAGNVNENENALDQFCGQDDTTVQSLIESLTNPDANPGPLQLDQNLNPAEAMPVPKIEFAPVNPAEVMDYHFEPLPTDGLGVAFAPLETAPMPFEFSGSTLNYPSDTDVVFDSFPAELPKRDAKHAWVRVNRATAGRSSRSGKINQYDASKVYKPLPNPYGPWESFGFEYDYNSYGELCQPTYTIGQLREFIYQHPVKDDSPLRLWIQTAPADSARRYSNSNASKCRFKDCPVQQKLKGSITPGHYRVALDEKWHKYGEKADPFHVAGYVHLYCLERFLDFADICKKLDVQVDTRQLIREPNHKFAPSLAWTPEADVAQEFIERCRAGTLPVKFPNYPVHDPYARRQAKPHELTLTFAMNALKSKQTLDSRMKQVQKRGGSKPTQLHMHLGDLEMYCKAKVAARRTSQDADSMDDSESDFAPDDQDSLGHHGEPANVIQSIGTGAYQPGQLPFRRAARPPTHFAETPLTQRVSVQRKRRHSDSAVSTSPVTSFESRPAKRAKEDAATEVQAVAVPKRVRFQLPSSSGSDLLSPTESDLDRLAEQLTEYIETLQESAPPAPQSEKTPSEPVSEPAKEDRPKKSVSLLNLNRLTLPTGRKQSTPDSADKVGQVSPEAVGSAGSARSDGSFDSLFDSPTSTSGLRRSARIAASAKGKK